MPPRKDQVCEWLPSLPPCFNGKRPPSPYPLIWGGVGLAEATAALRAAHRSDLTQAGAGEEAAGGEGEGVLRKLKLGDHLENPGESKQWLLNQKRVGAGAGPGPRT